MIYEIETDSEPETLDSSQASTICIDSCSDGGSIHTEEVSEDSEDSVLTVASSSEDDDAVLEHRQALAEDLYCQIRELTSPLAHVLGPVSLEHRLVDCYQLLCAHMFPGNNM